jgi:hypothetical protein
MNVGAAAEKSVRRTKGPRAGQSGTKRKKMMREERHLDQPGGHAEEGKLAKLLLAGRAHRRRKMATLALARNLRGADEDLDVNVDDDGADEDYRLGRLLLLAAAKRRRRRRLVAALALASRHRDADEIDEEDEDEEDENRRLGKLLLLAAARRRRRRGLMGIELARRYREDEDIDDDDDDEDRRLGALLLMAAARRKRIGKAALLRHIT